MNELPKATFVYLDIEAVVTLNEGSILPNRGDLVSFSHEGKKYQFKKVYKVHVDVDSGHMTYYVEEP